MIVVLRDEWLTVTVRKPEVSLCLARGEQSAAAEPGLEALASGTRFFSGPVRGWCVLRRTSHPCH